MDLGPSAPPKPYKPYPSKYADACYEDEDHDAADLCAQWRAALAAEKAMETAYWGNYIAGAGAFLSFVSIVLVVVALSQTRKANRIAARDYAKARLESRAAAKDTAAALAQSARNADAAAKHVEIAQRASERQLRAYVYATRAIVINTSKPYIISIVVEFKNFGQTPAYDVVASINAIVRDINVDDSAFVVNVADDDGVADIAPAVHFNRKISRDFSIDMQNTPDSVSVPVVYAYGIICYLDAFNQRHESTFRYRCQIGPGIDSAGQMSYCLQGNNSN